MTSGVQLADRESRVIARTTAKALRVTEKEIAQVPDNADLWIQTYNENPSRIGSWIKSRLTSTIKPRQHSVLEYLMISHKDWYDSDGRDQTQADAPTSKES